MTQDEIVEMYLQVSKELCNDTEWCWAGVGEPLQMFAKLVAAKATAKEREVCAKICEEYSKRTDPHKDYEDYDDGWVDACYACKLAVTARGEA
jgi:hypothetical protein